ncbi:MAG: hypothetical protein WBA57_21340 [Elainellaceae cyanobacterium]
MATFTFQIQEIDCDGIYYYDAQQTVNFMAIAQGPACEISEGGYHGNYSGFGHWPRTGLSDGKIQPGDILFGIDQYLRIVPSAIAINPTNKRDYGTTGYAKLWPMLGAALAES